MFKNVISNTSNLVQATYINLGLKTENKNKNLNLVHVMNYMGAKKTHLKAIIDGHRRADGNIMLNLCEFV